MPVRFSISESGRGEDLEENLIALEYRLFDLKPMAVIAQEVMEWQNEQGALAGVDQYGHAYDKLAESTLRKRNGTGPPLAPQDQASRIINFFETDLTPGFDEYTVRGHWPGLPWIKYHKTGTRNMPERDPVGMRPIGWERLTEEFREWIKGLLDGGHGAGPAAPPSPRGGSPSSSGPLAPTAANGPGINRYDAPDDDDELMIDVRPARSSAAKPDASPLAPTKANGTGLVQHEPAPTRPAAPAPPVRLSVPVSYGESHRGEGDVRSAIREMFGPDMTPERIAAAAGAPPEATSIKILEGDFTGKGSLDIYINTPTAFLHRSVQPDDDGAKTTTIHNEFFELVGSTPKGTGIGTEVFARQVEAAHAAGFTSMKTLAARDAEMNGYYTWARLGYDTSIPRDISAKLPKELRKATRVSDLMATPEGRDWWKANGDSLHMDFDLTPGSYSRRTLDAYLESKGKR